MVTARRRSWQPRLVRHGTPWLLAALILLVIGAEICFSEQQHRMDTLLRQQQQQGALAIAEEQRETRLLNDYTRRISSMIAQNPHMYGKTTDPARVTASTLTQDTLHQLNPEHKVALLRYLYKVKLIDDDFRVVSLKGADFHGCNLVGIDLSDTDLSGANFSNADMRKSKLSSSTLVAVNFNSANLAGADLKVTDMHDADIHHTNLAGADLAGVIGINIQQLLQARSLAGARLPDGSTQPGEEQDSD